MLVIGKIGRRVCVRYLKKLRMRTILVPKVRLLMVPHRFEHGYWQEADLYCYLVKSWCSDATSYCRITV